MRVTAICAALALASWLGTPAAVAGTPDADDPTVTLQLASRTVYPLDGDRDSRHPSSLDYRVGVSEPMTVDVVIEGPDGVVADFSEQVDRGTDFTYFPGRDAAEGRYTVSVGGTDSNGRTATARDDFRVTHAQLRSLHFEHTVPAARTLLSSSVGACSSLTRPSTHRGWRGSLGYGSLTRCSQQRRDRDVVATAHRLRLPRSYRNSYTNFYVTLYGAASSSRPGSRLATWLVSRTGKLRYQTWAESDEDEYYLAPGEDKRSFIRGRGTHPFAEVVLATGGGARYDVKWLRVGVDYQAYR